MRQYHTASTWCAQCLRLVYVCVREGSPQSSVSYYRQSFLRSCLTHIADTIMTDSFCCARRKTGFKIRVFKSNYYASVWASAQLNSRRHSITLPLMEENLWVSKHGPVLSWQTRSAAASAGGFGLCWSPSALNCEQFRQGCGQEEEEARVSSGSNRWWEETEPSWKVPEGLMPEVVSEGGSGVNKRSFYYTDLCLICQRYNMPIFCIIVILSV